MAADGDVMVVWYESFASTMIISARVYSNGEWGSIERLSTGIFNSFMPDVAMNDNGDAVVAWHQFDDVKNVINVRTYNDGVWGSVETISTGPGSSGEPKVAMNDHGDAAVVWQLSDGPTTAINAAVRSNGAWSGVTTLSTGAGNAYPPQVAMSDSGDAVATWHELYDSWGAVYASTFSDGSWGEAERLSAVAGRYNDGAQVAMSDHGDAIVVWRESYGPHNSIIARIGSSGEWDPQVTLSTNAAIIEQPQVAMNGSGAAAVVWKDRDGSRDVISMAVFTHGTWNDAATISDSTSNSYFPQVAMNDQGDIVAVWSEPYNFGGNKIARTCLDGTWSSVERLTDWLGGLGLHQVAIDQDGDAVVVWHQPDGYGQAIGIANLWVLPTATIGPNGNDVAVSTTVTVTFSEPMDHDTVEITVEGVDGTVSWNGNVATFAPAYDLEYDTQYTVHVFGEDIDGNNMTAESTFTTLKDECTVSGMVADGEGRSVAGAAVIMSNGMTSITDDSGRFYFSRVASGLYELNVTKEGFEPLTVTVNAVAGQNIELGTVNMSRTLSESDSAVWIVVIVVVAAAAVIGGALVMRRKRS